MRSDLSLLPGLFHNTGELVHTKHNLSRRAHFCTVLSLRFVQIECTLCEHGDTAELLLGNAPYKSFAGNEFYPEHLAQPQLLSAEARIKL